MHRPAQRRTASVRTLFASLVLLSAISAYAVSASTIAPARAVTCERFGSDTAPLTVVFLHGASGADPYREQARQWAAHGYLVLFPHFYDATQSTAPTDANYTAWIAATADCIAHQAPAGKPVVLFGISLGASVALAAGTQLPGIDAVVDWAGSLPDTWFFRLQRLPPLLILHGDEDANVPVVNARQLFQLCDRRATKCDGTIYKHDGHVFPNHRDDATARTLVFLKSRSDAASTGIVGTR